MKYITSLDDLGENAPYTLRMAVEDALAHGPCYVVSMPGERPDFPEWLVFSAAPLKRHVYSVSEVSIWVSRWYWGEPFQKPSQG